jgi:hypothetical protein
MIRLYRFFDLSRVSSFEDCLGQLGPTFKIFHVAINKKCPDREEDQQTLTTSSAASTRHSVFSMATTLVPNGTSALLTNPSGESTKPTSRWSALGKTSKDPSASSFASSRRHTASSASHFIGDTFKGLFGSRGSEKGKKGKKGD